MPFARGDMRDHIVSHKNDRGASYWHYAVLQWWCRLKISFCEIFGVVQFSTFATLSPYERTSSVRSISSEKCQEGTFGQALLYISELMATQIAPAGALPPEVASSQRSAAGRPSWRSPCPGGPCSTSFACDLQPTGPGIQ